jgi:hypothetical protein
MPPRQSNTVENEIMNNSAIQLAGTPASIFTAWQKIKKDVRPWSEPAKSTGSKGSIERR